MHCMVAIYNLIRSNYHWSISYLHSRFQGYIFGKWNALNSQFNLIDFPRERTMWPAALTLLLQIQPGRTRCVWATCWASKITSSSSFSCCVSQTFVLLSRFEIDSRLQNKSLKPQVFIWSLIHSDSYSHVDSFSKGASISYFSFEGEALKLFSVTSRCGFSVQHHWHVRRIHS